MGASQYKDYVLALLFIKYVSDKYAGVRFAPITVPKGASFADMAALKGKPDIGDAINKKIIAPLFDANRLSDAPDFNGANKLGSGKELIDRLTDLIAIFQNPALDFSKHRAADDDLLGDAYEYPRLTAADIKTLVVDDKWLAALARAIGAETERAGQHLTQRIKELAERYAAPLPQLETRVAELQEKVDTHLKRMGFAWA